MLERITVVCGNAGTGKSTWARALAVRLGAALLDLDTVSERLVVAAQRELGRDPFDRDSTDYKRVFREPVHETLFAIARECGGQVVLVAPFTRERRQPDFPAWLNERCGEPVLVHYFFTRDAEREARLRDRKNPRDHAKLRDYAAYGALGAGESPPPYPHVWFDTTATFPDAAVLERITGNPSTRSSR
jgi:predicted kinase